MRRIQLDLYVIKGWLGLDKRGARESTETMGALLKRKKDIDQSLEDRREEGPARLVLPARPAEKKPRRERSPDPAKPKGPDLALDETTTGRLLALKKRREEEEGRGK